MPLGWLANGFGRSRARFLFHADILGMVQVMGECLCHGLEFVFNHHENVISVVAFMHKPDTEREVNKSTALSRTRTYSAGGGAGGGDVEGVRARMPGKY
jgi:hypothetical protein